MLDYGRVLLEGTPAEVRGSDEVRRRYLGSDALMADSPLLRVEAVDAYYGRSHVLQSLSLAVENASVVALLGRNGAGKSTTLKAIMGIVAPAQGSIHFDDKAIHHLAPHRIARPGHRLCARGPGHLRFAHGGRTPLPGSAPGHSGRPFLEGRASTSSSPCSRSAAATGETS